MKGFTIAELLIVIVVLSILSLAGMPVIRDVVDSNRILATVESMEAIAAAADVARRLPGGDSFNNVTTNNIAVLLNTYDVNPTGIPLSPMTSHWGTNYTVNTTGQYATVSVSLPFRDISPFGSKSVSNGPNTTLLVSHKPQGTNRPVIDKALYNKKNLYLE